MSTPDLSWHSSKPDVRTIIPEKKKEDDKKKEPDYSALVLVGGASLTFILSNDFLGCLDAERGDYLRIRRDGNRKRLIIEKDHNQEELKKQ